MSGRDKGRLVSEDFMVVDLDGRAVGSDHRPSAETGLHTQLYRRFPDLGCVHTHSHNQTVASRLFARRGYLRLAAANSSPLPAMTPTTPRRTAGAAQQSDIPALAARSRLLDAGPHWGYLIEGHGLYAQGRDMTKRGATDAFEFLARLRVHRRGSRPPSRLFRHPARNLELVTENYSRIRAELNALGVRRTLARAACAFPRRKPEDVWTPTAPRWTNW